MRTCIFQNQCPCRKNVCRCSTIITTTANVRKNNKKNENTINNTSKIYQIVFFFCAFDLHSFFFFFLMCVHDKKKSAKLWSFREVDCVCVRGCLMKKNKGEKKSVENFFSFARFFLLSSPTSALRHRLHNRKRTKRWRKKSSRQKNQKHSIDGQAMKSFRMKLFRSLSPESFMKVSRLRNFIKEISKESLT